MNAPMLSNPSPQSLVMLIVALWHHTMAIMSFTLDQLFILLLPGLVVLLVQDVGAFSIPREPDFVQEFLSVSSNCVIVMTVPLISNPLP
jgi:hypothetical protein